MQIGHFDRLSLGHHIRMRRQEHPADVREKESASRIVRIGRALGELVMYPVIVRPRISVALNNFKKTRLKLISNALL